MRTQERQKVDTPVMVTSSSGLRLSGHCVNLSEVGAGCIVPLKLTPGDFVLLELSLPMGQQTVLVSAQVRYCCRYYCGLAFIAPANTVTDGIRSAIPEHGQELRPHYA